MARRKRRSFVRMVILLAALVVVLVLPWVKRDSVSQWIGKISDGKAVAVKAPPDAPSGNEGRTQQVSGELASSGPARDSQLGVSANAAVLFRHAEMYQWQEHCVLSSSNPGLEECRYETNWSGPVDSSKFRESHGHAANPLRGKNPTMPFSDAVFFAPDLKIGANAVDPRLLVAQLQAAAYAVHDANLPPNLAASFGERDGVLYAGGDPAHPAVGEVRVSYRIVPLGIATLTGVQRGMKLMAN